MPLKKFEPIFLPDTRRVTVSDIEDAVRSRWHRKDPKLEIKGLNKKDIGKRENFDIFTIDCEWIRDNLDVTFGTGGHGLVHSFVPMNEIWIDPVVESRESLIFHEIAEHLFMRDLGLKFPEAHKRAIKISKKLNKQDKGDAHIKSLIRVSGLNKGG